MSYKLTFVAVTNLRRIREYLKKMSPMTTEIQYTPDNSNLQGTDENGSS